jgi:hypothetical protein
MIHTKLRTMTDTHLQTPVAFLIFNRPDTTRRVFEAIRQARPAKLLVVADGPRPDRPDDAERCAAARAVLDGVDWDCEILTNFADANLGCKLRISSGLDWVFKIVAEAIILEDDCVPHPDFFPFCAALLEKYYDDERVMMIGGTNYLGHFDTPYSYLFSRYFAIWGWATWRRAWQKYDLTLPAWETYKVQRLLSYHYPQRYVADYLTAMFDLAHQQRIDTWDIQWFYACLFNNGLSIVPRVNLIANIGSAAGTHTLDGLSEPPLPIGPLDATALRHPAHMFADRVYDEALFQARLKTSLLKRVRQKAAAMRQQWKTHRS